jgi:hypothetical protein
MLNASSGHSELLVFRDGAKETLKLMATVAHLITAYRLAHLSLPPAQEKQVGALLATL